MCTCSGKGMGDVTEEGKKDDELLWPPVIGTF